MSRVIKFRAWDNVRKKFFTSSEWVDFKVYSCGTLLATNTDRNCKEQELIVMQFTGLHDIGGREVFEGDIVSYLGDAYQVLWEELEASFFAVRVDGRTAESGQEWFGACSVIGNIYQNPELLK